MGLFRTTVKWQFPVGSGGGTNTWNLRTLSSEGSTTEVAALMGLVKTFYQEIANWLPSATTLSWDGLAQELASPAPTLLESATPWTVNGSNASSAYGAAPVMACITWRSSLASRRGRGRTFFGPMSAAATATDGTLDASTVLQIREAAADLVSASLTDTNGAVVVFSELDGIGRDIIASSVTDQAAVLRSRR